MFYARNTLTSVSEQFYNATGFKVCILYTVAALFILFQYSNARALGIKMPCHVVLCQVRVLFRHHFTTDYVHFLKQTTSFQNSRKTSSKNAEHTFPVIAVCPQHELDK